MSSQPRDEQLGSAAQEAARLVEQLQGWFGARPAEPADPAADAPSAGVGDQVHDQVDEPSPHEWSSCRVCPVCRAVDAVQRDHPQVVEHLVDAVDHLAQAFRELVRPPGEPGAPDEAPPRTGRAAADGAQPAGRTRPGPTSRPVVVDPDPGNAPDDDWDDLIDLDDMHDLDDVDDVDAGPGETPRPDRDAAEGNH
ncbi:hypothetical protein [Angustibacter aerolatus]